jgi:hypothetical protein
VPHNCFRLGSIRYIKTSKHCTSSKCMLSRAGTAARLDRPRDVKRRELHNPTFAAAAATSQTSDGSATTTTSALALQVENQMAAACSQLDVRSDSSPVASLIDLKNNHMWTSPYSIYRSHAQLRHRPQRPWRQKQVVIDGVIMRGGGPHPSAARLHHQSHPKVHCKRSDVH